MLQQQRLVLRGRRVHKVLRAQPAHKVLKDHKVILDPKVLKVMSALLEHKALRGQPVHRALLAHRAHKVHKDRRVLTPYGISLARIMLVLLMQLAILPHITARHGTAFMQMVAILVIHPSRGPSGH